jgi:hypothetical protein
VKPWSHLRQRAYILFFLLAISLSIRSQETSTGSESQLLQNSLQVELGGHGVFLSVNYERLFFPDKRFKTSIQGEASFNFWSFFFPVLVNEIVSFNQHHIELGIGYIPAFEGSTFWRFSDTYATARAAYRFQRPNGRFIFRSGFTPIFGGGGYLIPMFGASFGRAF